MARICPEKVNSTNSICLLSNLQAPRPIQVCRCFRARSETADLRFALLTSWKVVEKVNVSMGRKIASACQTLHDYASLLIDERLTSLAGAAKNTMRRLLICLAFHQEPQRDGRDLDQAELKETFLNLIILSEEASEVTVKTDPDNDWAMARDPQYGVTNCLEFRPARWIDDNGNIKQFGHFKFHAFNVCLGMNFAILQCICMIVEVFHNFELELEPEW
ncbi:hypothetical protein H4Q26_011750 [Puccinia striiformis f. sp. tritici PST-130]|nr:hypothetical protein H4Q26_011750 [Puccinia striiformis f. sp. tritici PST-130]